MDRPPIETRAKETPIKSNLNVVRQAHHERNQQVTVRPEPVEGLNRRFPKIIVIPASDRIIRGQAAVESSPQQLQFWTGIAALNIF